MATPAETPDRLQPPRYGALSSNPGGNKSKAPAKDNEDRKFTDLQNGKPGETGKNPEWIAEYERLKKFLVNYQWQKSMHSRPAMRRTAANIVQRDIRIHFPATPTSPPRSLGASNVTLLRTMW